MPEDTPFRSGFVSMIGRPNAGKSTLINALVGEKVSIVADKPQTTQTTVQAVWSSPAAQIVFLDTPGIHRGDTLFNRRMMSSVRSALEERDLLLYVVDATRELNVEDTQALDVIRRSSTPAFLLLNKIDRIKEKHRLLPTIEAYQKASEAAGIQFAKYLPVSALTGQGLPELTREIISQLPEGPAYFPEDEVTDQPRRFLAAEFVRERILTETRQEVPHSVAVLVERWEDKATITHIIMTIYVERDGQKAIIIGNRGSMLKKIGTRARAEIEAMVGRKVFLELFVKVRENWRQSPEFLNQLDWRTSLSVNQSGEISYDE